MGYTNRENAMARSVNRLTAVAVQAKSEPRYYPDGGGLYLRVQAGGAKSWVYRFMLNTRAREMGLGTLREVSLVQARKKAEEARQQVRSGVDPIAAREALQRAQQVAEARGITFDECAKAYIDAHRAAWKNVKHQAQWSATLTTYASPVFGRLPVAAVDTALVMKVLEPLWGTKTETASRVRGRIENVLDWAKVRGYREGENPARWRGHLDHLLPKRAKVQKVRHHPAMPYAEVRSFLKALRAREGVTPKALEFIILTAVRVSEAVNAKWDEIDEKAKVWTIPGDRMKSGRDHRVPLSEAALRVLKAMKPGRQNDWIFPGWVTGMPLTIAAPLMLLQKDMGYSDLTVHGFRSAFRDWAAEQTNFPRELAEAALAHVLKDKTEAAYQRGDLLERRREMMNAWSQYLARPRGAKVIELRRKTT
jgi:integrase